MQMMCSSFAPLAGSVRRTAARRSPLWCRRCRRRRSVVRRARVVHRERGGAEVLRTDFQRIELDAVGHHQRHRVAAADPKAGQAGRDPAHVGRVLPPGHCLGVAGGAKCDSVGVDRRDALNASHSVVGCSEGFSKRWRGRAVQRYIPVWERDYRLDARRADRFFHQSPAHSTAVGPGRYSATFAVRSSPTSTSTSTVWVYQQAQSPTAFRAEISTTGARSRRRAPRRRRCRPRRGSRHRHSAGRAPGHGQLVPRRPAECRRISR